MIIQVVILSADSSILCIGISNILVNVALRDDVSHASVGRDKCCVTFRGSVLSREQRASQPQPCCIEFVLVMRAKGVTNPVLFSGICPARKLEKVSLQAPRAETLVERFTARMHVCSTSNLRPSRSVRERKKCIAHKR